MIGPKYQSHLNVQALDTANKNFNRDMARSSVKVLTTNYCPIRVATTVGRRHANEIPSAPIFNYARFRTWTADVEKVLGMYEVRYHVRRDQPSNNYNISDHSSLIFQDELVPNISQDFFWLHLLVSDCSGGLQAVPLQSTGSPQQLESVVVL